MNDSLKYTYLVSCVGLSHIVMGPTPIGAVQPFTGVRSIYSLLSQTKIIGHVNALGSCRYKKNKRWMT